MEFAAAPDVDKTLFGRRPAFWLVIFALLLAVQISPWWDPVQDGANYLSIARSVAHGHLLRFGTPYIRYAPGYPISIAPAFWFSDQPFLILAMIHWVMAIAFMLGVYYWVGRYVSVQMAVLITGASVLNAGYWHLVNLTLSETLFLGLFWWAAWAIDRLLEARSTRSTVLLLIASMLLLCAASATRQVAVLLLCGLGIRLLRDAWQKRMSWTRAIALGAIIALPSVVMVEVLIQYNKVEAAHSPVIDKPYTVEFLSGVSFFKQICYGIHRQIDEPGQLLIPGAIKLYNDSLLDPDMLIYIPFAAILLWGWWKFVRERWEVTALAMPFYIVLYAIWPFEQQTRFLVPLIPLGFLCVWRFAEEKHWNDQRIWMGVVAAHLFFAIIYFSGDFHDMRADHKRWPGDRQLAAHITSDQYSARASMQIPTDDRLILEFWLDRPIIAQPLGKTSPKWWVILHNQSPPPGYTRVCEYNNIALYHADDTLKK